MVSWARGEYKDSSNRRVTQPEATTNDPSPSGALYLDDQLKGSVVVGGERAQHGLSAVLVVPDHGGEREESFHDAVATPCRGWSPWSSRLSLLVNV